MKYYESPGSRKKWHRLLLYLTTVACVAAIGIAAWMTSKGNRINRELEKNPGSLQSEPESSYPQIGLNDTESFPYEAETPVEPTENSADNIPYEEPSQAMIMPADGEIIKDFSNDRLQFSATYNDLRLHTAIDIGCEKGTAVYSCAAGEVTAVEQSSVLGSYVTVAHDNGVIFRYCGLEHITVSAGQKIEMGHALGAVGEIPGECADKAHLHLEASADGKAVSPLKYIGITD